MQSPQTVFNLALPKAFELQLTAQRINIPAPAAPALITDVTS